MSTTSPNSPTSSDGNSAAQPTSGGRDLFLQEILDQPDAIRSAADRLDEQRSALDDVAAAAQSSPHPLVLTGMGSSYDAAAALASSLARSGRASICLPAAELLHFQLPAVPPNSTIVVISQSGESAEAVRLAEQLTHDGSTTVVSVTNGLHNSLARLADIRIDIAAGNEEGPSTKTFAATMVALTGLRDGLLPDHGRAVDDAIRLARDAADRLEQVLTDPEQKARAASEWMGQTRTLAVVGRGTGLAAAELVALVLKESAHLGAIALDSAEFRHGPMEMAGSDLAVAIIDIEADTTHLEQRLARDLRQAGSPTMVIGTRSSVFAPALSDLVGDPLLDAAIATAPLLLLAWQLSTRIAAVPGTFRVGRKTTTEE